MKKNCVVCGSEFDTKDRSARSKTCSKECSRENRLSVARKNAKLYVAKNKNNPEWIKKSRATKKRWKDKTRHIRNKYDDMNKQNRQCVVCEKEYVGHFQSKTCSEQCRLKHRANNVKIRRKNRVMHINQCKQCGKDFLPKVKQSQKFCNKSCADKYRRKNNPKKKRPTKKKTPTKKNCKVCGLEFEAKRSDTKYCSKNCAYRARHIRKNKANPIQPKVCVECGKTFTPISRSKAIKFCSNKCRKKYWRRNSPPKPKVPMRIVVCKTCKKEFSSNLPNAAYCSKECKRLAVNKKARENKKPYSSLSPLKKLNARMGALLRANLRHKGILKNNTTYALVGYTKIELRKHLESKFTDGMSWERFDEIHIDHIRPVASFNYTTTDCEDFKKCWALENLQPLWAKDNCSKGSLWKGKRWRVKT